MSYAASILAVIIRNIKSRPCETTLLPTLLRVSVSYLSDLSQPLMA